MILGGVEIPYEKGLLGHSDADIAYPRGYGFLIRRGGPGRYWQAFSDSDPLYLGADSLELLRQVCHLLKKEKLPYRKY